MVDRYNFVIGAATSYVKLTLSLGDDVETNIAKHLTPLKTPSKEEIMDWINRIGWEKLSCMDESIFMMEKERLEWNVEREESPSAWYDFLSAISCLYEKSIQTCEPTNIIWDHMLSICLIIWDEKDGTMGIKELASKTDGELDEMNSDERHVKETIRALKRIRMAEAEHEPKENKEEETEMGEVDDEVLLGLQSKMKDMLSKIQDPDSNLGRLMMEIMEDLKKEDLKLDTSSLMKMMMQSFTGFGEGKTPDMDAMKDGPIGKIMEIVQKKIQEKVESGGMDELKNILESTKDILGKNPEEMKETLMKVLNSMVNKMGIPKQAQQMIFGQMNKVIEKMTQQFMSGEGPAPTQEEMQNMLGKNMNDVMRQFMARQNGVNMSGRKARRMAAKSERGTAMNTDPRLARLQQLKERLRKKQEKKDKNRK